MRAIAGRPLVAGTTGRASWILAARQLEDLYRWRVSRIDEPGRLFREPPDETCPSAFGPVPFLADPTEKMMYADSETYLPEDILTKVDRASMAVSLEVRAPFLDHRLVEFAWRLPVSERIGSASGKRILRALGRRYLPAEVLQRPKMGFCVPVEQWLKGPLRGWAEDSLSQDRLEKQGLFDVSAVRKLWRDFLSGRKRHERVLWNLLMFEAWARQNSLG
jgi:asparagine synthase (glutamine-hydrolysing)